ncbi:hypothetical protein [Endozoicomonas sp. SCSIO W0465]|uniref:hypothetical protein n=1 Tax=Endozoicomonas sp. SCSIO W0465 TaxID=2918516 RepID=UPI0020760699|nr:hypothetical protein [Endozoicomonas sp. SCSIO W0465]USE38037.1 hypothetical protein MJO57_07625 [Endozoicomonas sp. SCSIO W0465]
MKKEKQTLLNLLHDELSQLDLITNELKRAADHYLSTDDDDQQFEFSEDDLLKVMKARRVLEDDISKDCFFIYLD